ncbi:acyl-CoA dehydrogenase family protein [Streptomyces sp. NPDC059262]|uniref:acyl-CoA dehydrogenase family protein n=1 Tax=Streptomyces sp. NPDC059262 TaxID=3346797 RepID=UPI0036C8471B
MTSRFEEVDPVRTFRWSHGDRHFPGWYWATTGRHVGFESWLERDRPPGLPARTHPSALGAPLATLPCFQTAVGEIETALTGASTLVEALAARTDAGEAGHGYDIEAAEQAGIAKVLGTRAAIGAVEQAVALTGNHGLTRANPLQRHYRDVLCSRVHTPLDDSVLTATGRAALARALDRGLAPKGN